MSLDDLLAAAEDFAAWDLLKAQDKDLFESSGYENVLEDINVIQSKRESTMKMMNMRRIQPFLTGMAHFEKVLRTLAFPHTAMVMAYVWGPVRYLLKVRSSFPSIPPIVAHGLASLQRPRT